MIRVKDHLADHIINMILGAFSFSIMAVCVKVSCKTLPSTEVVFFRSFLGTFAIAFLMWKQGISWKGKNRAVLALRGLFGFGALSLHFYTISKLDLGTAVMLNYTAPIFAAIFAYFLLKENITPLAASAILLSFAGLYLLVAPQLELKPGPVLLGLLSGILAAVAYVLIRFNHKDESPYTIIFYFTAISTLCSISLLPLGFKWPQGTEWMGLLGVSASAFFGQVFLTKSIQGAPVAFVLPFGYLTPVFSALFGIVFWREFLTPVSAAGAAIVIGCGICTYLLRKRAVYIPIEE